MLYYYLSTRKRKGDNEMPWKLSGTGAVFSQLADKLRRDIVSGVYPPDSQFPTVRQLASEAAVNPNTMQKALLVLEEEQLLYSRGTVGRFVTYDVSVLNAARDRMIRDLVRGLLVDTYALGISPEMLMDYINQEDKKTKEEETYQ